MPVKLFVTQLGVRVHQRVRDKDMQSVVETVETITEVEP
jgi:hypothetical protein